MFQSSSSQKLSAKIIGTGSYLPGRLVTNLELEKKVRNFDRERAGVPFGEWAESVTGIKERCYADVGESTENLAVRAAKAALDDCRMKPEKIDFIITCSFTPARQIPNLGCSLAHLIGAPRAGGFVLNTACAGFIYGLALAYSLIRAEMYRNILVAAAETLSLVTNYGDPTTAILFADGAGAAVLQAGRDEGILSPPYLSSDFSDHLQLKNPYAFERRNLPFDDQGDCFQRTYITMPGGPRVLRKAVNAMAEAALNALKGSPYRLEDVDYIIPHQANRRITVGLAEKLGVPMEKVVSTIETYGNTSGASVAISLDKAVRGEIDSCQIKRGDKIVLTAIGGGYSLAAAVLKY